MTRTELDAILARVTADQPVEVWHAAGEALASMSKLPHDVAHQLGSGTATLACWPPQAEIIDFALAYEPLATRDEVFAFTRQWLADETAGRCTVHAALGELLLYDAHERLALRELDQIVANLGRAPAFRTAALSQLGKLVG